MNDIEQWQECNARELAAAVAGLRQRLERCIQQQQAQKQPASSTTRQQPTALPSPEARSKRSFLQRLTREQQSARLPLPLEVETREALTGAKTNAPNGTPSALAMLSERLGLSAFEQEILLLCAAMELDTRVAGLCARAQDDPQKNFPTFALALALFGEASWDALSPERPLRFWHLIEISQFGAQPLTASALCADERIVNYLKGLNYLDERISSLLAPLELAADALELAASQESLVRVILRRWKQAAETGSLPVAQLVGADPQSKQLVAHHVAAAANRQLHRLPVESLPANHADLELLARFWRRESLLLPLALYLDAEELSGPAERSGALHRFLSRSDGLFFLGVRETLPHAGCPHFSLDIAKPAAAEQKTAWAVALGEEAPEMPAQLVGQFNLNLTKIHELAHLAKTEAKDSNVSLSERIWATCRASERPRMDALAQRLDPKVTWDDLVLPPGEMKLLREIAAQVRQRNKVYEDWGFSRKMNRGFGISALFAGDSGCGKTMAAEVIANELRLNLYRIDLSAVVNKYIGETEKNLRRLFDAAEEGGSILFFDEADALFGKRSEVKDSHDRYANIEINYLLQRLESYRGLAILATNMKSALDTAFLRRLRFIINFPFPGIADRRRLWENVFLQQDVARKLPGPPLETLDYERLARLNLTGGNIYIVALNACFTAASSKSEKVTMPLVLEAARAEFMKLDRPINETDFKYAERAFTELKPVTRNGEAALV